MSWTLSDHIATAALEELERGDGNVDWLRTHSSNRAVARVGRPPRSVIVKLWCRRGPAHTLGRLAGTHPMIREVRALRRLAKAGVRVPKVLGRRHAPPGPWTDAIVLEDLGTCLPALDHLRTLHRNGATGGVRDLLEGIAALTERMIGAGVLDTDHGLCNILVTPRGTPARVDLEVAEVHWFPRIAYEAYGHMLGRLFATLALALAPDRWLVRRFAGRLMTQLDPPAGVRVEARRTYHALLQSSRHAESTTK